MWIDHKNENFRPLTTGKPINTSTKTHNITSSSEGSLHLNWRGVEKQASQPAATSDKFVGGKHVPPWSLTARLWKMVVGRRQFPFGKTYFQGCLLLVLGRVQKRPEKYPYGIHHWWTSSFEDQKSVKVWHLIFDPTVDGWNPKANHLGWCQNLVNNGITYQPQLVIAGFQPSTVSHFCYETVFVVFLLEILYPTPNQQTAPKFGWNKWSLSPCNFVWLLELSKVHWLEINQLPKNTQVAQPHL